jgi:Bacterial protein of unknown function (Gcw_chp)
LGRDIRHRDADRHDERRDRSGSARPEGDAGTRRRDERADRFRLRGPDRHRLQFPRDLAVGPQLEPAGLRRAATARQPVLCRRRCLWRGFADEAQCGSRSDHGIRPKFGPITFDLGLIYYWYPGERTFFFPAGNQISPSDTDFLELAGKVSWAATDTFTIGAGVFHTQDWLGTDAEATYLNVTAKYAIPAGLFGFMPSGFAVSGELGYYDLGTAIVPGPAFEPVDYTYWNVGASYAYKNVTLDLRYHDTDLSKADCFINTGDPRGFQNGTGRSKWCKEAFIATLAVDFTASQLGIFAPAK